MSQLDYSIEQDVATAGLLADIADNYVRSYTNGTSVKKRYTVTVDTAADAAYALTLTDANGVNTAISFDEGAVGTVGSKRDGLIAAINESLARFYVTASVAGAGSFYVESDIAGQDFTLTESDANLSSVNDVSFVANTRIGFGLAMAQGAQDNECRLLSAISDKVVGVSIFQHADQENDGLEGYAEQSAISTLVEGPIYVQVEEAVSANDPVFVRAVATGSEKAGAFRKQQDGTDCIELTKSRYLTSAAAGGYAIVMFKL